MKAKSKTRIKKHAGIENRTDDAARTMSDELAEINARLMALRGAQE